MTTRELRLYSRNDAILFTETESLANNNNVGSLVNAPFLYRVKAGGNAGDTADGAGCRSIKINGLSATGTEVSEVIATNGALVSADGLIPFFRMNSIEYNTVGTALGTSIGDIMIEKTITGDVALMQTNGATWGGHQFTVPLGYKAIIRKITISSNKDGFNLIVTRYKNSIAGGVAPYSASEQINNYHTTSSHMTIDVNMELDALEMTWLRLTNSNDNTCAVSSYMEGTLYQI